MPTITFNGESFTVDHAVKGADYIHGFDAEGVLVVAFDGVTDFSAFTYDGTYMNPSDCLAEQCNNMVYCGGVVKTRGGTTVPASAIGARPNTWMPTASDVGAAAEGHKHAAGDITSGTLSVSRGGTGRSTLTSGSFLKGNGTSAVTLRTPAQVLSDIGAPAYEEGTWTPTDVNSCGLVWSSSTMLYTKIGRFVHVLLKFKAASSTTGKAIVIGGLPFEPNCTYPSSLGGWTSADGNGKAAKTGFCVTDAAQGSYNVRLVSSSFADTKDSDIGASRDATISLYFQIR